MDTRPYTRCTTFWRLMLAAMCGSDHEATERFARSIQLFLHTKSKPLLKPCSSWLQTDFRDVCMSMLLIHGKFRIS
jgi:hypothetical protein